MRTLSLYLLAACCLHAAVKPFPLDQVRLLEGGPFHHAQKLNQEVLLRYDLDRLLADFREEAGLEPKAEAYEGWEADTIAGHSLGHHLSACALTYAATGDERFLDRVNYIVSELAEAQEANGNGYVGATPDGLAMYEAVSRGEIETQRFRLNGIWAPIYTLHKIFAGLRDAYRLADNRQALEVARKLGDWTESIFGPLPHEQTQKVLYCEHGGINEVLADLGVDAGDARYIELARKFHHEEVLDPLIHGKDILPGIHGNTQVPKLIGLARLYEVIGDRDLRRGAEFFWDRVANHHSYVTGGHGLNEYFGEPDELNNRLAMHTSESCNVYNMLKLTTHVFGWAPEAEVADFYERALYNHILATQHPTTGRVIYHLTLDMGGYKIYEDPYGFTCCVGTGMENHSKYGAAIYFHDEDDLYVNLFIPSELTWPEKRLLLTQTTEFPKSDGSRLEFSLEKPAKLRLKIRYPGWAQSGVELRINGDEHPVTNTPSSFIALERTWRDGDAVEFRFPKSLRLESMPDNLKRAVVFYGPLVLAGDLGPQDDPRALEPDYVPVFLAEGKPPEEWLEPVPDEPNAFRTKGAGRPRDVTLRPFYLTHDRRYSIYWDFFTEEEWAAKQVEYRAAQRRKQELEARTVDYVAAGEQQPETDHNMQGENTHSGMGSRGRRYRSTTSRFQDGWFSYDMKLIPGRPQSLIVTYWGGDEPSRKHQIEVDGRVIAERELKDEPAEYFNEEYPLPDDLVDDTEEITVTFRSRDPFRTGGIFGVRIVTREQ